MSFRQALIGVFFGNRSDDGIAAVKRQGQEDGHALAAAYADGFTSAAAAELRDRLQKFRETGLSSPLNDAGQDQPAITQANVKNLTSRKSAKVKS